MLPMCLCSAALQALIESGTLDAKHRRDVRLYYGAANPAAMAYYHGQDRDWAAANVKVVPVFSVDGRGYVQDVFAKVGRAPCLCWS